MLNIAGGIIIAVLVLGLLKWIVIGIAMAIFGVAGEDD